jgi:hypothetical protein
LFSATLSSKLRSQPSSPPRPTLVIYTFDLYPEVSQPHFDNAHAQVALVITVAAKTRRGLELKGDFGAVSGYNDLPKILKRYNVRFERNFTS